MADQGERTDAGEQARPPQADRTSLPQVGVTCASFASLGVDRVLGVARQAAEMGFGSFWAAETTGTEAFSLLAAAGAHTPGVDLGTGVLALQLRSPGLTAMGAATLASLYPDRDILVGVGVSSPVVTSRWHGIDYGSRPLSRTREFVELLRRCASGEVVDHHGEHYQMAKFRLGMRPPERPPKVVLGALNERMLTLAGEIADGVLLNYLPADAVPWCVSKVRDGERTAGRPEGSCRVYAYVHVGVCERDAALTPARRDLFSYAVVDAYARAFRRAGFADEVDQIRAAHAARDRDAALAAVSDRMIDAIDIVGDAEHVRAAVGAYLDAGVDHAVVMPLPWGPDRMAVIEQTLAATAP